MDGTIARRTVGKNVTRRSLRALDTGSERTCVRVGGRGASAPTREGLERALGGRTAAEVDARGGVPGDGGHRPGPKRGGWILRGEGVCSSRPAELYTPDCYA